MRRGKGVNDIRPCGTEGGQPGFESVGGEAGLDFDHERDGSEGPPGIFAEGDDSGSGFEMVFE